MIWHNDCILRARTLYSFTSVQQCHIYVSFAFCYDFLCCDWLNLIQISQTHELDLLLTNCECLIGRDAAHSLANDGKLWKQLIVKLCL